MPAEQEINELIFRGFSAQIRIGDRPLTIYKPDYDEETKTASGWIASEPGKEYFVCWKKNDVAEYAASGRVSIDGPRTRSILLARADRTAWVVETGERITPQNERPFLFSELSTTGASVVSTAIIACTEGDFLGIVNLSDDDNILDKNIPTDPGTIKFEIFREKVTSATTQEWIPKSSDPFSTRLHEKTKKAGGHVTKIGDERKTSTARTSIQTSPFTDADTTPYVTFVLRYRPEGILRAGGFMPGHENQLQGEVGADNEDGDEDDEEAQAEAEIAALQAALKVRVASLAKRKGVKQEDVEADLARKRRKVKQEEAINADLYFTPGEVIDLTDL
ncbi:hypothetical protein FRC04_006126 [Tulasnella sp. 424]|nr:hypothetical protein FRC04_006126 [Tulasnella sp. 424]